MDTIRHISGFFHRLLGLPTLVKGMLLPKPKYTNEYMIASYPVSLSSSADPAKEYWCMPPALRVEFGEFVDMIEVDGEIQIIGKCFHEQKGPGDIDPEHDYIQVTGFVNPQSELDYVWYEGRALKGKEIYDLYREFLQKKVERALEELE